LKDKSYIPALTGVRAVAAWLVFFHHYNKGDFPYPVFRLFNEFHIGVSLFFVLSGFLICFRYYDNIELSRPWFGRYMKNRIARIYPMYFLLTLATFAYAWHVRDNGIYNGFQHPGTLLVLNLTFLRGFFDELKFTGIAQGWSLTVEECFYLLAPFFFILIRKKKQNIFYLPLLILLSGVVLVAIFSHIQFYGFYGNYRFMFLYTFTGRCIEFFAGIALAIVVMKNYVNKNRLPLFTITGIIAIGICLSILAAIPLTAAIKFGLHHPAGIFTNNLLLPVSVALLFYGLIKEQSIIRRILSTGFMQLLGKSSYIFYLIHIGFIAVIVSATGQNICDKFQDWLDDHNYTWLSQHFSFSILFLSLVFIALNIVSIVLFKLVEEPMNRLIRKISIFGDRKMIKP